jgi:hypothetical protein
MDRESGKKREKGRDEREEKASSFEGPIASGALPSCAWRPVASAAVEISDVVIATRDGLRDRWFFLQRESSIFTSALGDFTSSQLVALSLHGRRGRRWPGLGQRVAAEFAAASTALFSNRRGSLHPRAPARCPVAFARLSIDSAKMGFLVQGPS